VATAVGHAVTDLELGDLTAHRIDDTCAFRTQSRWQGRRCIQPAAVVSVDEVQANGFVKHSNLLRSWLGRCVVHILKYFGAAVGAELDSFGHLHFS